MEHCQIEERDHTSTKIILIKIECMRDMVTRIKSDRSSEKQRLVKLDPTNQSIPAQNDGDIRIAMPKTVG